MKKMFRFAAVGLMLTALPFTACKDDDDDVNCTASNVDNLYNDHLDDIEEAFVVLNANPNTENCNKVISELEEYLSFLKDYEDCATDVLGYDGATWTLEIQATEQLINQGC
jgi:hypothetical protein